MEQDLIPPRAEYETESGRIIPDLSKKLMISWRLENKMRCCRCRYVKDKVNFTESNYLKNKYPYCKECQKKCKEQYMPKVKNRHLFNKFKITYNDYKIMFKKQKGKCAICKNYETIVDSTTKKIINLAVDHCHITLKIRDLLCSKCNFMIGYSRDSDKILRAGARYMQKHKILD